MSLAESTLSDCLQNEFNQETLQFSRLETLSMVTLINQADSTVAGAIQTVLPAIAEAVDAIAECLKQGGRLFYIGAGTSGRLAVLDSAECPPTFGTSPELVQSIIAGGQDAMLKAVENIEDSPEAAIEELKKRQLCGKDVVVGIAASGRTPFTLAGIDYANGLGALTVAITTRGRGLLSHIAKIAIAPDVGPEVLSGSTRMKSGTAQKMILGMLSTCVMGRLGRIHTNLMIDVVASNIKLLRRAERIVSEVCGIDTQIAAELLVQVDYHPRRAILMYELQISAQQATDIVQQHPNTTLDKMLETHR
ncbi:MULTISPECIES: N-acetylmuramic acid 6-phosphate etherase [Providencia]|uniref:N-acetylmuramic acid 6-phosphate etherase n=1 Tax=Providencia huashanensis TaxID=3037798 RepID=A0AA42FQ04_9GAMM|nr:MULTISPECIES: N-acetylmuramic acid 6-phosphate etherase [Providencia]HCI96661.1 N-acetylmuramic acid 6-phosphate etherase [Providencia sp.]APC10885.1 N-acetylmuramic acid 6-phosphate etherase [Providencia rettgeri]AVL74447.1 N-acetylmuramic acid 6-phosphate etherase [Providencia rettgeri]EIL1981871.1 N-acetylmuramic acid 6-phosphate etherase [Providencia rettgeri]EIU7555827.1 N-acetylmuramic acid 6-phosphate etherase [Providencia rettgeri]